MRKLAIVMAAALLVAVLTGGVVSAGPDRTVRTTGGTQFVPNNLLMVNLAFAPGPLVVDSGDTVTWVHADSSGAPHTVSIVDQEDLPDSVSSTLGCRFGAGTLCSGFIANPEQDVGEPGLDMPGDSLFLPPGGSVSGEVTASSGTTLHYFCAIHPLMQGSIKVR
jgi:plastocyanin